MTHPRPRIARRGFTVIELLVVITIVVIVVLIALPRFARMLEDQQEQLAVNLLRVAMKAGRDAAMASAGDEDTAIVFFYRPGNTRGQLGGRLVMAPYVKIGTFQDDPSRLNAGPAPNGSIVEGVRRDVFVPYDGGESIVLPRNWMARGYAPPNSMPDPQSTEPTDPGANWYDAGDGGNRYTWTEGNWVFPETDFYDLRDDRAGNNRQTFMVRFKAVTGEVVVNPNDPVLIVDVRPYYEGLDANSTRRLYDAYDRNAFMSRLLDESGPARQLILGRNQNNASATLSSHVVLARPVRQIALNDETRLAASLGVEINRDSGCLYRPRPAIRAADNPANFSSAPAFINGVDSIRINQWIEGDTNLNNLVEGPDGRDEPRARVFSIDRYTGTPLQVEVQP